jgi:hypothetical protein
MGIPELKEYRPIVDWPTFRVLRVVAISAIVLGLIVGGTGKSVGGVTADAVFGVCAIVGIVLGFLCIFFTRACPKCGRTMTRRSPGWSDYVTSYKYVCPECRVYIDTFLGHGGD